MFSRGWTRTFFTVLLAGGLLVPGALQAKFRDAIHFEDNQFVDIGNFELMHRFQRIKGHDTDVFDRTELLYQLSYGVMRNFEVGVRVPIVLFDDGDEDVGDVSLRQRFKFTEETYDFPESSGGFELFFPTGDEDATPPTGSDSLNVRLFAGASDYLAPGWTWLIHGGVTFFGDGDVDEKFEYNAAVRYRVYPAVKTNVEFNGSTGGLFDESKAFVSPGLLLYSENDLSVIFSAPIGLTSDSPDHKATFQVSHEF